MQIIRRAPGEKRKPRAWDFTIDIEPVEYQAKEIKTRVATFDTETDPFMIGRIVKPFTCGLYFTDTKEYIDFWGDDCIEQFVTYVNTNFAPEELTIFVHNGGNFDFYFLLDHFDKGHKPFIINGRLVKVQICGQEFRDSYSMIPVPLGAYDKDKIDYRCLERGFREVFKETILSYQKRDCTALAELVTSWLDMFGNRMTMASVALPMLRSHHGFETVSEKIDADLRPYYFGGRNQCFATGIMSGSYKVYDINSSYPNVMRKYQHPISDIPIMEKTISDQTMFAHIRAWSLGALPVRGKGGALEFPIGTHDFYACIHEINAGILTGTLRIKKVYSAIRFAETSNFAEFVDHFYSLRLKAKGEGDLIRTLFYKLVMNSSYGKFAQDPRKYENWLFDPPTVPEPMHCEACYNRLRAKQEAVTCQSCSGGSHSPYGWYLHTLRNDTAIYASPQKVRNGQFFNVATAASITSAARAELLKGIQAAINPIYCDTDSVICESLENDSVLGIELDGAKLGAWDIEASGDTVAIAGKKLYAIFNAGEPIKKASKGVSLSHDEIRRVAEGETIEYAHPVPKFKLNGDALFTTRKIMRTG